MRATPVAAYLHDQPLTHEQGPSSIDRLLLLAIAALGDQATSYSVARVAGLTPKVTQKALKQLGGVLEFTRANTWVLRNGLIEPPSQGTEANIEQESSH